MSKTLSDLNSSLHIQLERLLNADLKQDEFEKEVERSKAVSTIARDIIQNGKLALEAKTLQVEYGGINVQLPTMIESK